VDSKAGLDDLEKRKVLTLLELELRPSVVQSVASRYTDYVYLSNYNFCDLNPIEVQMITCWLLRPVALLSRVMGDGNFWVKLLKKKKPKYRFICYKSHTIWPGTERRLHFVKNSSSLACDCHYCHLVVTLPTPLSREPTENDFNKYCPKAIMCASFSKSIYFEFSFGLLSFSECIMVPLACFPPQRPSFDPRSNHVGCVVQKVALG
jgi:hypothetical protein